MPVRASTSKLVFFAYSKGIGVTYHLVQQAIALVPVVADMVVVVSNEEQEPGLIDQLRAVFPCLIYADELQSITAMHRPDWWIFHCQGFAHVDAVWKSGVTNKKIVLTMHAYRHGSRARWIYPFIFASLYKNKIDKWVFTCEFSRRYFLRRCMRVISACKIPLGTERSDGDRAESVVDVLSNSDIKYDTSQFRFLMYFAQFSRHKRHELLLDRLARHLSEFDDKLILFGDGPLLMAASEYAESLGIRNKVVFAGRVPRVQVNAHLKNAYVCLVPSLFETFGHNYLEPINAGVPIIATSNGVSGEIVSDYYNGFLCDFRSERDLTDKLRAISVLDKKDIGLSGLYRWNTIAESLARLYEELTR